MSKFAAGHYKNVRDGYVTANMVWMSLMILVQDGGASFSCPTLKSASQCYKCPHVAGPLVPLQTDDRCGNRFVGLVSSL